MTPKPVPARTAPDVLGRVLLPLRAFLGFTFCFAGLQKLANPRAQCIWLCLQVAVRAPWVRA